MIDPFDTTLGGLAKYWEVGSMRMSGTFAQAEFDWLPVAKLREIASGLRHSYESAQPYPHIAIDGLFDPDLLHCIVEKFPRPDQINWDKYHNGREVKLGSDKDDTFDSLCRIFLYHLNSAPFLDFLSELTGIDGLIADSHFTGGGMLAVHADFNKHPVTKLDRRLNVLVYLNEDWQDEYGGHFELWDRSVKQCLKKIAPLFNRLVVFTTTDISFHGHPDPLNCPPDRTRKSLALYYYTNGRPDIELSGQHSTLFKARPGESLGRDGAKTFALAMDLLPPVLVRTLAKARRRVKANQRRAS
jgi:hypothetical protein